MITPKTLLDAIRYFSDPQICELGRAIGVTQRTAWFMLHRIRKAMEIADNNKFDGPAEADTTYIGGQASNMHEVLTFVFIFLVRQVIYCPYYLKCQYENADGKKVAAGISAHITKRGEVMANFNDSNCDIFNTREDAINHLNDLKSRKFNYSRQVTGDANP